jgi:DNA-binding MarR family transcriptional regulator/GNAT superfamily N-acetyltransferase
MRCAEAGSLKIVDSGNYFVEDVSMPRPGQIELIRGFNRFYTRQIGLLREGLLETPFSLTQARVLYELGSRTRIRSRDLIRELGLDPGYLSRLLKGFERQGLIKRTSSREDRRVSLLTLTPKGRAEFESLNMRSEAEITGMLAAMSAAQRKQLVDSMTAIQQLLEPCKVEPAFVLRTHRPGDIGWVVARHGELYAREYRWDSSFEGLVAKIAGDFLTHFDERRERCWIAERNGEPIGSVFLVKHSKTAAKLRLLLVEPSARGLGVGTRLVDECIAFARRSGYRRLTLWTNSVLHAARKIYERAGFRLVKEEMHHSFGRDLVGQYWALRL